MQGIRRQGWMALLALSIGLGVAGCSSFNSNNNAPVDNRSIGATATEAAVATKPPPGIENAGKPGYYTVRPGDTIMRIALDTGQAWRDLARWNNLDNPNVIEVGQVLRVVQPVNESGVVVKPVASSSVTPVTPAPAAAAASAPKPSAPVVASIAPAPTTMPRTSASTSAARRASRCWRRPMAASFTPARDCAAMAIWLSSSTTTRT